MRPNFVVLAVAVMHECMGFVDLNFDVEDRGSIAQGEAGSLLEMGRNLLKAEALNVVAEAALQDPFLGRYHRETVAQVERRLPQLYSEDAHQAWWLTVSRPSESKPDHELAEDRIATIGARLERWLAPFV